MNALPVLGKGAPSTERGYAAAMSWFDIFQDENENPRLANLKTEDTNGEGQIEYVLGTFAFWLAYSAPKKTMEKTIPKRQLHVILAKLKKN